MEQHLCDVCETVLKGKIYFSTVVEIDESLLNQIKSVTNTQEYYNKLNHYQRNQKMEIKELCPTCYELMKYLFGKRKKEVKKLVEEMERSYQKPAKPCSEIPRKVIEIPPRDRKKKEKDNEQC